METAHAMVEAGGGWLRLVALAPEIPGMDPIIEYFLSQGITVAAAHSDNNYKQAMAAYAKGISVAIPYRQRHDRYASPGHRRSGSSPDQ